MNNQNNDSITFAGLLQAIFITLKLLDVIKWSWFWVLSPVIISVALSIVYILIGIIIVLLEK